MTTENIRQRLEKYEAAINRLIQEYGYAKTGPGAVGDLRTMYDLAVEMREAIKWAGPFVECIDTVAFTPKLGGQRYTREKAAASLKNLLSNANKIVGE